MSFSPTAEQEAIIEAFATGEDMVIEAGAGTGKTSTLKLLAQSTDRTGYYLAFNKAVQVEAERAFPSNVKVKTTHALAWGAVIARNPALKRRLNERKRPSREQVATTLGAKALQVNDDITLDARVVASLALAAVERFCNSADEAPTAYHVPLVPGAEDHRTVIANHVAPYAVKAWADITSDRGSLFFTHSHYLKMWSLSNPVLKGDFIMLDEAQDTNPCVEAVVLNQTAQKIMVGDRCQAIYGWRGATDAMTRFQAPHRLVLSQSFRFGPAVAEQANLWLTYLAAPLRLSGFEKIESTVEAIAEPDAILCRTNAGVIQQAMDAQETGKAVAIVGGTAEIKAFAWGAQRLMSGQSANHPELDAFKTWTDAVVYAASDEGADLRVMVRLCDTYGPAAIIRVCENSTNEDAADIIVSTAHKAKGREWDRVRIGTDFKAPEEGEKIPASEAMLCYVAVTRAKLALDNLSLPVPA